MEKSKEMRKPKFWTDNNGNLFDFAPDLEKEEYEKYGIIELFTKEDLEDAYNQGSDDMSYRLGVDDKHNKNFEDYYKENYGE